MRKYLIFFYILIVPISLFSINISEAITIATTNNLDLMEISNNILLQQEIINIHLLEQYPDLSFSLNYLYLTTNSASFSTRLDYPVFNGGEEKLQLNYDQLTLDDYQMDYKVEKWNIEYTTKIYFYEVIYRKSLMELRETYLEQAILEKEKATAQYNEGMTDNLSLQAANQYYLLSQYNLIVSSNNYIKKITELKNYLQYSAFESVEGDFFIWTNKTDYLNDIRLQQLEIDKDLNELDFQIEYAQQGWQIDLYTLYYYSQGSSINAHSLEAGITLYFPLRDWLSLDISSHYDENFDTTDNYSVGGTINIFDENKSDYNMEFAEIERDMDILDIDSQITQINAENLLISNKLIELKMAICVASNEIELKKLNLTKIELLFENGERTAQDLLDARLELIDGEVNHLNTIYQYNTYIWELEAVFFNDE